MKFPTLSLGFALSFSLLAKADFPGSTFFITYNTTSPLFPSPGSLSLLPSTSPSTYLTALSPSDSAPFAGYFTYSGSSGYLHLACPAPNPSGLLAYLVPVPADAPVGELAYLLQWRASSEDLPEGTVGGGFQLGPEGVYDEVVNILIGAGSWQAAQDADGQYVIGWSTSSTSSDLPITLVKGANTVNCLS